MNHKITFTTQEVIVLREAIHALTIKGNDAWIVGGTLDKIYKEIEIARKKTEKEGADIASPSVPGMIEFPTPPETQMIREGDDPNR